MSDDGNRWVPLESNPEVMTKCLRRFGVPSPFELHDVLGLESEALSWLPKPALALLLLFPCSERYEADKLAEDARLKAAPQDISPNVFYLKQTVHNACGTVALVHSVANNVEALSLEDGCLKSYIDRAKDLDPEAKGKMLENDLAVIATHLELANEGQSRAPSAEETADHHFVALVHRDGRLYELDGRKSFPIVHGPSSAETFLEDAAAVCRAFMARDPDNLDFTVIALTGSE